MTTPEPGLRLVLMYGKVVRPASIAFFASKPAPNITEGLLVFVQLVMEEITTDPEKNR